MLVFSQTWMKVEIWGDFTEGSTVLTLINASNRVLWKKNPKPTTTEKATLGREKTL